MVSPSEELIILESYLYQLTELTWSHARWLILESQRPPWSHIGSSWSQQDHAGGIHATLWKSLDAHFGVVDVTLEVWRLILGSWKLNPVRVETASVGKNQRWASYFQKVTSVNLVR